MNYLKIFFIVVFAKCVLSDRGASLLDSCVHTDMECLSRATEKFLEKTCKGIPQHDIRAIDPLIINSLDHVVDQEMGLIFHFKNLTVTGLKNQKISDFKMDTSAKTVVLKTKADVNVVTDIVIELSKSSKSFAGTYSTAASILGIANYNYDLKKDDKGVEHFEIGPETISCEVISEPQVTLNSELQDTLLNDPDAKSKRPDYDSHMVELRKETVCRIVKAAYVDVVHNIRAAAKILPKTAFFKDI